jgi:hypothetical protein
VRLGNVRVSRLALLGDPVSAALGLFSIGSNIAQQISLRGKTKRRQGVVGKGIKAPSLVAASHAVAGAAAGGGAGGAIVGNLPNMVQQVALPGQVGAAIGRAIARGGLPAGTDSQGRPIFPVSVSRGRRRMNVLNPRALRRSITRVTGFARFARKTIQITHRVKLKRRRRR